jgi:hypothetical protein
MGSPCFLQLNRYERTASRPLTIACSGVSPSEWHPGRSGYSIKYPPPSSDESGRIVNGYLSIWTRSLMNGILQLGDELHKVAHVPGLDRNVLGYRSSSCGRVPECHMACTSLAVNINTETPRDNLQILHTLVARVSAHAGEDLLGVGHIFMVPNTTPWNNSVPLRSLHHLLRRGLKIPSTLCNPPLSYSQKLLCGLQNDSGPPSWPILL